MISNEAFLLEADPARGGALTRIADQRTGAELLRGPGNELVLQEEYATHPRWGEGPWLLSPKGPGAGSADSPAAVQAQRCAIGSRLTATFTLGGLRVSQETIVWDGLDRVEFRTHVDGSIGQDALLRVRFAADVPGGLPVYQGATAVVGRPFGIPDADAARHTFTLDNPAHEWFGLGSAARVVAGGHAWPVGVAEVVLPAEPGSMDLEAYRAAVRSLIAALAAQGVTATCTRPGGPRYGAIDLDSNVPDCRIALGGPGGNPWTARLLATLGPAERAAVTSRLASDGAARIWLPATRSRAEVFGPDADVRAERDLPVLIVAGPDLTEAIAALTRDLAGPVIAADAGPGDPPDPPLAGHCVALLNRGTPSSLVTPDGTLHIALMRASSAWPAGVWIDGERRTAPDGSSFAWQHWSHTFEYALAAGPGRLARRRAHAGRPGVQPRPACLRNGCPPRPPAVSRRPVRGQHSRHGPPGRPARRPQAAREPARRRPAGDAAPGKRGDRAAARRRAGGRSRGGPGRAVHRGGRCPADRAAGGWRWPAAAGGGWCGAGGGTHRGHGDHRADPRPGARADPRG